MDVVHPRCCGIDIYKASVAPASPSRTAEGPSGTSGVSIPFTGQLREMGAWLAQWQVAHIVMEATGVYWKPVWNALEEGSELLLVNPQHLKSIPRQKDGFQGS